MNSNEVDERIRAALTAAAGSIEERDLRPAQSPTTDVQPGTQRSVRWIAPLLAAAAVIGVAVATAAIVYTPSAHHITPAGPTNSVVPTETLPSPPSSNPVTTVTASKPPASSGAAGGGFCGLPIPACEGVAPASYEPLWPFADYAQEQAWQAASKSGGAQPWHLDSGQTALLFTQNYLGFTDITEVTSSVVDGDGQAHIGVGYPNPNGQLRTAAVLHLVRYSPDQSDTSAGWEVVGSDDTDFSLEQPAYVSTVTSPMTVGGHITGVDENIVVDVKDVSGSVLTGTPAGVPAGGQKSPWQASVSFTGSGVLAIVAFTGGHLTQHERFAIQGVHTA